MVIASLTYAFVGEPEGVFGVKIDDSAQVWELKKAIKDASEDIKISAKNLQIFLAKTGDAWLKADSEDVKELKKGRKITTVEVLTNVLNELQGEDPLNDVLSRMSPSLPRKIHVLVVAPKHGTSAPIISHDGIFHDCSTPFFSQFSTVDRVGDWLKFSSLLPLTRRQKLYIRSSYRVIANQALLNPDANMVKHAVVTGTPGFGKSVFVYYVMWRLIRGNRRVLFLTRQPPIYFDGVRVLEMTPDVLYMPPWSHEELATTAHMCPNTAAVLLESACNSCSLDECKTLVSINLEINSRTKIAQTLIHIHSQEPC